MRVALVVMLLAACGKGPPADLGHFDFSIPQTLDPVHAEIQLVDKRDNTVTSDGTLTVAITHRDDYGYGTGSGSDVVACTSSVPVTRAMFVNDTLKLDVPMKGCPTYTPKAYRFALTFAPAGGGAPVKSDWALDDLHPTAPLTDDERRAKALLDACVAKDTATAARLKTEALPAIERDLAGLRPELRTALEAVVHDPDPCKCYFHVLASPLAYSRDSDWEEHYATSRDSFEDIVHAASWPSPESLAQRIAKELAPVGHGWLDIEYDNGSTAPTAADLRIKVTVRSSGMVAIGPLPLPRLGVLVEGTFRAGSDSQDVVLQSADFEAQGQDVHYTQAADPHAAPDSTASDVAVGIMASQITGKLDVLRALRVH